MGSFCFIAVASKEFKEGLDFNSIIPVGFIGDGTSLVIKFKLSMIEE